MKRIAVLAALLLPMTAHAREAVPPSRWTQNYIPSLQDWQAALLCNGASISTALGEEILRATGAGAVKLNKNDDTPINQTLTTPTISGGTAIAQAPSGPTINGGMATGQGLSGPTITNGTATGLNVDASISTPADASNARLVSDKFGEALSVMDFGAKCDGSTDDTTAFNAAISAVADTIAGSGGKVLHHVMIPGKSCVISGVVNLLRGVWLSGTGAFGTQLIFGNNSQILFAGGTVSGSWVGSRLSDFGIQVSGAITSAQKFPIDAATNQPVASQIDHVQITGGTYYGIDMSGNEVVVDNVLIPGVKGIGIRVGHGSTHGDNTDPKITNSTVSGDYWTGQTRTSAAILTLVEDAGGLTLQNNDMIGGRIGTQFYPQAKQTVFHVFASNTVLSDSAQLYGMEVETGATTSIATDMKFEGSWTANALGMDVAINNNGAGTVDGYMFVGHRYYLAGNTALYAGSGVNNVTITGSQFCGNNGSGAAVFISPGDAGFVITGNRMPSACADEGVGNSPTGVNAAGNNDRTVIVGNDMSGIAYPIDFTVSNANSVTAEIANNIGPDKITYGIAAGATTTLLSQVTDYTNLTTTAGVSVTNIANAWIGRHTILSNQSGSSISFATGGNICSAYTLASGAYAEAVYTPNKCWYLH
ncbi:hypothetical protein [Komagataeibacter swingsii]|uniref:Pectate lyase superfamily protein domain-containing protein n=1 Tax=Komagataeibacter swingsii TaxID=215220 RepID=A0A850P295_9PROT|nr:hypothetical protein [Komagataeibacter swingsii]NVN36939.1 hypothetical protein [Komagataeibacter swingsii]